MIMVNSTLYLQVSETKALVYIVSMSMATLFRVVWRGRSFSTSFVDNLPETASTLPEWVLQLELQELQSPQIQSKATLNPVQCLVAPIQLQSEAVQSNNITGAGGEGRGGMEARRSGGLGRGRKKERDREMEKETAGNKDACACVNKGT